MNTTVAEKRPFGALGRMGAVAGLHAAALYLIATSLGIVPPLISEPTVATVIDEVRPPDDPPPATPQPQLVDPRLTVPPPDQVNLDFESPPDAIFAEVDNNPPRPPDIIPTVPQHTIVAARMDSRYPLTQPTYPARDIREGNEGTVELEVYVMPTGRIGDVRVVRSTGSPSLDQSAIDEAKRRWRMLPATRDGEPYAQWHRLKVTFNLKNR
jgi:protein TonB